MATKNNDQNQPLPNNPNQPSDNPDAAPGEGNQ